MAVAERHGVALTMYHEYCSEDIYGDALRDVAREIHQRGHDLELHAHLDFLSAEFWSSRGLERENNLNLLSPAQAQAAVEMLCERHARITGSRPVAFRGGGYRFSAALLDSLAACQVMIDSSVNVSRKTQPAPLPMLQQFRWANDMIELPIANVRPFKNLERGVDFNFSSAALSTVEDLREYLETFYRQFGDGAVAVLVLHSWSLQRLDEDGQFTIPDPAALERFDEFLGGLEGSVEVVTTRDISALASEDRLVLDDRIEIGALGDPGAAATPSASVESVSCPICGADAARFVEMAGRRCPDCGSLERQRALAFVYDSIIRDEFPIDGIHAVMFSPAASELRLLFDRGLGGKTSVDVRPDTNPDLQADICNMPALVDASTSLVVASYVMPVVYDLEAAISEVHRILEPGGAFISVEPVRFGQPTQEQSDEAAVSRWYGEDALNEYRVGQFRQLGDLDYLQALQKHFVTKTFTAHDPITTSKQVVHLAIKHVAPPSGADGTGVVPRSAPGD